MQPVDTPFTLRQLQGEQRLWVAHNFGTNRPKHHPVLGAAEEIGELCHTILKSEQKIRSVEDVKAAIADAVADTVIYLSDVCSAYGIDFHEAVASTWASVKARDWKKFPKNGRTE